MKSNFAALLILFITGCGSDAVDATSTKVDETGGVAGTSTAEVGGDTSASVGGSGVVTSGGSSSTTNATTTGGSSSTTTTAAGNGQGGQGTQATGGSSQSGVGGSAPTTGGSSPQATGGSTAQATGGSAPATGGKAGAGSGGTTGVGGISATGGRTVVSTGGTSGVACNPNNAATICNAFQTCDTVTRTCTGPIPSSSVNCSGVVLGVQVFGYTSPTMPTTTLDTRASCQAATVASTNPSTQNWCCSINKEYCVVRSDVDTIDCPNSGATAGKPYIYDCVNDTQGGKLSSSGCVKVAKTSASMFINSGYCCATSTIE